MLLLLYTYDTYSVLADAMSERALRANQVVPVPAPSLEPSDGRPSGLTSLIPSTDAGKVTVRFAVLPERAAGYDNQEQPQQSGGTPAGSTPAPRTSCTRCAAPFGACGERAGAPVATRAPPSFSGTPRHGQEHYGTARCLRRVAHTLLLAVVCAAALGAAGLGGSAAAARDARKRRACTRLPRRARRSTRHARQRARRHGWYGVEKTPHFP